MSNYYFLNVKVLYSCFWLTTILCYFLFCQTTILFYSVKLLFPFIIMSNKFFVLVKEIFSRFCKKHCIFVVHQTTLLFFLSPYNFPFFMSTSHFLFSYVKLLFPTPSTNFYSHHWCDRAFEQGRISFFIIIIFSFFSKVCGLILCCQLYWKLLDFLRDFKIFIISRYFEPFACI